MKIGLFIDTFYPMVDGVIKVVDNYARILSETDEVTVFCPTADKNANLDLPYKVVTCPMLPLHKMDYGLPLATFSRDFKRELEKNALDIVHIHSPFTVGRLGLRYAKKHNIPSFATIHSMFDRDIAKSVKRGGLFYKIALSYILKTFKSADYCFSVNKKTGEHFIKELGLKKSLGVLPNASALLPVADEITAHDLVDKTFGIKKDQTVYLYVGRIDFIKNLDFLVKALKIIKDSGNDFKMLFVGDGHDREALSAMVEDYGLTENVIFCGKITDKNLLAAVYSRAKLLLFPSLYDANSLVQLEAAAQKTPAVFIKGSTTSSTTIDGVNAFWAENDPAEFAKKVIEINLNDELYKTVSEGAKKDLFITWEDSVKTAREYYHKAIENNK